MIALAQDLWDEMRADLRAGTLPQMQAACRALLSGELGPLTAQQTEDVESVERGLVKLARRAEGEPINWADHGDAAHALRGPLNSTLGFSRLMLKGIDGAVNAAQMGALETIHTASQQLLVLFNLFLDALSLAHGQVGFDARPILLNEVLDELVPLGQELAAHGGFTFRDDIEPTAAQISVAGDVKRLKQALTLLMAATAAWCRDGHMGLRAWLDDERVFLSLQVCGCQPLSLQAADIDGLLTDEAGRSLAYDTHLRLGVAWWLLTGMDSHPAFRQADGNGIFTLSLPPA